MHASHINPLTGEDEMATGRRSAATTAPVDPNNPDDLGQGPAQCALPLRVGPQVQALSRALT